MCSSCNRATSHLDHTWKVCECEGASASPVLNLRILVKCKQHAVVSFAKFNYMKTNDK